MEDKSWKIEIKESESEFVLGIFLYLEKEFRIQNSEDVSLRVLSQFLSYKTSRTETWNQILL